MSRILVSCPVPVPESDAIWKVLRALGELCVRPQKSRAPLARDPRLKDAAGIVTLLTDKLDEAFFKRAPNLKVVGNIAVGYDNIDVAAATKRGIVVCNTPDVLTNATAELAVALLFAAARRFKEGTELLRRNAYKGWDLTFLLGAELKGSRLGVIGNGRIGQATAEKARALGMSVVTVDGKSDASEWRHLLGTSDFLSIHCPLNAKTRGLLDRKKLAAVKPGAYLINTARGELVDEKALVWALEKGLLSGAALDVFCNEPRLNPALRRHPRVFVLPHVGSATLSTRAAMARLALSGVAEVLSGRNPRNRIN